LYRARYGEVVLVGVLASLKVGATHDVYNVEAVGALATKEVGAAGAPTGRVAILRVVAYFVVSPLLLVA
jgi:hypothetical protein